MTEPVSLTRPRALKVGDRVAVLSVSSPVDPEALNAGLDALRFAGLDPVTYPSAHDPGTMCGQCAQATRTTPQNPTAKRGRMATIATAAMTRLSRSGSVVKP